MPSPASLTESEFIAAQAQLRKLRNNRVLLSLSSVTDFTASAQQVVCLFYLKRPRSPTYSRSASKHTYKARTESSFPCAGQDNTAAHSVCGHPSQRLCAARFVPFQMAAGQHFKFDFQPMQDTYCHCREVLAWCSVHHVHVRHFIGMQLFQHLKKSYQLGLYELCIGLASGRR